MSDLTLADALEHYRSVDDATHRFWSYFQLIAVGLLSFTWLTELRAPLVYAALSLFFAVFAFFNGRLVCGSQGEAVETANAINLYVNDPSSQVPKLFHPFLKKIDPSSVETITILYVVLCLTTLGAMWARLCLAHFR